MKPTLTLLAALLLAPLTALYAAEMPSQTAHANSEVKLWYRQPAQVWEEALPVGNGRLGVMVFGGVQEERLQLNEGNIWSGNRKDYDRKGAYNYFPDIRNMIYDGKHKEPRR